MENTIAIVTGGVTGIGKAVAKALSGQDYRVVVCDVDVARGKEIEKQKGNFYFRSCDVADEKQVCDLVQGVRDTFGRIDVLVNNAGIIRRRTGEEISVSDWDEVYAVNARGALSACRALDASSRMVSPGLRVLRSTLWRCGNTGVLRMLGGWGRRTRQG